MVRNAIRHTALLGAVAALLVAPGCRKHKYENPITKDTQQPDKVLFDTAIDDIEHGRFERARLTLQTLMNTYDTSEYLAKAKLAVADSWYREGGAHGLAQAEAEYKDFILFYKNMEEAAEAQEKICKMQYQQMDKADRDPIHAYRAQEECKALVTDFPNSKFAPEAQQYLRNVQEVLAEEEFKVGTWYQHKGSFPASANRFQGLTDQYPLYSKAADALWSEAESYQHMGDNFEPQQAAAYTKIVREYPLSSHAGDAKVKLEAMKRPVPQADPAAYAREKYEMDNRTKRGLISKAWGPFASHPDTTQAAKSGTPAMAAFKPGIPYSVPQTAGAPAANGATGANVSTGSDVTVSTVNNSTLLDSAPDARIGGAAAPGTPAATPATPATPAAVPATGGAATPADAAGTAPAATNPTDAASKPLPQNHTGNAKPLTLKQQQKLMVKAQGQAKKMQERQKKAAEEQAKKDAKKKKKDSTDQAPAPAAAPGKQ